MDIYIKIKTTGDFKQAAEKIQLYNQAWETLSRGKYPATCKDPQLLLKWVDRQIDLLVCALLVA